MSDEHDQYAAGLIHLTRDFKIDVPATQDAIAARLRDLTAQLAAATARAEAAERYTGTQLCRSDFRTAGEMRAALDAATARAAALDEAGVVMAREVAQLLDYTPCEIQDNPIAAAWLARAKEASDGTN